MRSSRVTAVEAFMLEPLGGHRAVRSAIAVVDPVPDERLSEGDRAARGGARRPTARRFVGVAVAGTPGGVAEPRARCR